jgi:hypothetical protein
LVPDEYRKKSFKNPPLFQEMGFKDLHTMTFLRSKVIGEPIILKG